MVYHKSLRDPISCFVVRFVVVVGWGHFGPYGLFWGEGYGSKTVLGFTHVIEQLLFFSYSDF